MYLHGASETRVSARSVAFAELLAGLTAVHHLTPSSRCTAVRVTHLSHRTAGPVFSISVASRTRTRTRTWTRGRVSPLRRGETVRVCGTAVVVTDTMWSSVPLVSVTRCRVEPGERRTSAATRRRGASSHRGATLVHVAVNQQVKL